MKLLVFLVMVTSNIEGLIFREDQFTDMTQACLKSDGKPIRHILNADNPAMYVSVDSNHDIKKFKRAERTRLFKKITADQYNQKRFLQDLADGRRQWLTDLKIIQDLAQSRKIHLDLDKDGMIDQNATEHFDCILHFETELPRGEKFVEKYDALSLFIIEYHPSQAAKIGLIKKPEVEIMTLGHQGFSKKKVHKTADYSTKLWPGNNPNFLLSGQLTGLDTSDFKTKVDPEHLVKPESLHSTFDRPASVTVNLKRWYYDSHIYIVITSYKYLRNGERCQEGKEFDCFSYNFLSPSTDRMCISTNLACDGVPNCGQSFLPNQDENCFKIHWSSVLLSLVSYILLAITLLLCLSCFARVLIQWSVRSSLAELRTVNSPTGSFRSSSRFFSFLGTTFSGRWERPPPTYDEALKHINPDLARPTAPPPYNDSGLSGHRGSNASHGIIETPPPEYDSHDGIGLNRVLSFEAEDAVASNSPRLHHHRSKHRGHHSRNKNKTVTTADVLATSVSAEALLLSSPPMYRSRAEAASSPMSPVTLTSVEINETVPMTRGLEDVSPSRFSSNSINTVILNPGVVSASSKSSAASDRQVDEGENDIRT